MSGARAARIALCAAIGLGTAAVRFLGLTGFSNDHYVALAGAQQMLFGEWPTRDFLDPGLPMMYAVSAAAQVVFGRNLFAEAVLVSCAFGLAAAFTVAAVRQLTGSTAIGVVAALFEVAMFPLTYSYPKLLLYAAAPLVIWSYVRQPTLARLAGVALFVTLAFLFRHDHGVYIGSGAAVAVALAPGDGIYRHAGARLACFAGLLALCVLPYAIFVSAHGGLLPYVERGLDFTVAESDRTTLMTPAFGAAAGLEKNSVAFLYYLFLILPFAAAAALVTMHRDDLRATAARVAPIIVIALLANQGFLRETLANRLADAVVPAVLLASWLATTAVMLRMPSFRRPVVVAAVLVVAMTTVAVAEVGNTAEQLNRASLFGGLRRLPERFTDRSRELHDRFTPRQMPAGPVRVLMPMFEYLDRCTTTEHRLLLAGFIPEVGVYARRMFAGGRTSFFPGAYRTAADEAFMKARLAHETIAVAVVPSSYAASMSPYLEGFIANRFDAVASYPFRDDGVEVLINRELQATGRDPVTGWSCFR